MCDGGPVPERQCKGLFNIFQYQCFVVCISIIITICTGCGRDRHELMDLPPRQVRGVLSLVLDQF